KWDPITLYKPMLTLENMYKFTRDPYYWRETTCNTIKIGGLTAFLTLLISYPIAYYVTLTSTRERTLLTLGFILPLFTTVTVGTLGWYILFLPYGAIHRFLQLFGIQGPVRLLKTLPALLIVMVHLHLPYALLILAASIQSIPREYIHAARVLGAPTWRIFLKIMLPLTMPGIVSSLVLVFTLSASAYFVPIIITGQAIPLLPIVIWRFTGEVLNWPFAAFVSLILFVSTMLGMYFIIVAGNIISKRGKWRMV
ncbi:MAG: ABC transporter permease, partial [Candidatus Methanomethyliaceae archaeon]